MPTAHPRYPLEYRRRIVELARSGRKIEELAREFEPTATAVRKWVKQAALDDGLRGPTLIAFFPLDRTRDCATVTGAMPIKSVMLLRQDMIDEILAPL